MTIYVVHNVLSNSGELRLWRYLEDAGSMAWVLIWRRYTTQHLLSVQKHLSVTLQWLCWLQVHVFIWWTITPILGVTAFMFTITTTIDIRIHVYKNTVYDMSLQIFFLDLFFPTCFQYPCWSSLVTSHTKSLVTCSNLWRCILAVMFSCASLFNFSSCELYRFRSHAWRRSNCMTMISQYAINFIDISLGFCVRINWKVILFMVSLDTIPFQQSHIMPVFAMQVWQWSVNLETVIGRII